MPNHVTHRVAVSGSAEDIAAFRQRCIVTSVETNHKEEQVEVTSFDFEAIIPMPAILREVEEGSLTDNGLAILGITIPDRSGFLGIRKDISSMLDWPWVKAEGIATVDDLKIFLIERHPECITNAVKAYKAYKETGSKSWYDWSIANWGTKWNSYSFEELNAEDTHYEFQFNTAWGTPEPIWEKLAELFPTLLFEVVGFDEGWNFAVQGVIEDGENLVEAVEATDELYERVYGEAPPSDDEDDEDEETEAAAE